MPAYETVFAVPSILGETERSESIKKVEDLIAQLGGSVKTSEEMGERKMAYKVKGHERAYYHLLKFDCPATAIDELKKHFRINSSYIRHMVVREED